jgi:thioredoxin reductase (NADPH)
MTLTVLSRSYCHLCDDLIAALEEIRRRIGATRAFEISVVDIDRHADLEAIYGDKVPVLLDGETEICHYFLNEGALMTHLQRGRAE